MGQIRECRIVLAPGIFEPNIQFFRGICRKRFGNRRHIKDRVGTQLRNNVLLAGECEKLGRFE